MSQPPRKDQPGPPPDALLGQALLASRAAILLTTAARRITVANAAAADLLGYEASQLSGFSTRQLYAIAEDWTESDAALEAAQSGITAAPLSVTLRRATGELFDADVTLIPSYDRADRLSGVIEIIAPALMPRAHSHTSPAEDDMSDSVRLARGAAHDFKNLLAIILGNVELAQTAARPKDLRKFLLEANQAGNMAARLADRMVGFARNRAGIPVAIDVAAAIAQQMAFLQHAVGSAITIGSDIAPNSGVILADRSALENALLNLALNARDAMPNGGTLTIAARPIVSPAAALAMPRLAKGYVEISITDTGSGMTERVRRHAFDPFFSTKEPSRGSGLGLATVIGFARQSAGTAMIETKPGTGTTVTLLLPAASAT